MQRSVNTVSVDSFVPAEDPAAVLRELFELLQDYAPIWYTEELHNRAAAALGEMVVEPAVQ